MPAALGDGVRSRSDVAAERRRPRRVAPLVGAELVDAAHSAGLRVYTWTLRPENRFLSAAYRRGTARAAFGDWLGEFEHVIGTGVDGIFVDHPDLGVEARRAHARLSADVAARHPRGRCSGTRRLVRRRRRCRMPRLDLTGHDADPRPRRPGRLARGALRTVRHRAALGCSPTGSTPSSARPSSTADRRCSSSPAPAPARRACSRTASRASSRAARRGRARSSRSRSRTRPRPRCASASQALLGDSAAGMWISTFHSACVRILRREAEAIGLHVDLHDLRLGRLQRTILKRIIKELDADTLGFTPASAAGQDLEAQERARRRRVVRAQRQHRATRKRSCSSRSSAQYTRAAARRERARLRRPHRRDGLPLPRVPQVASLYQRRFRHILVDEYQDTNHAQYSLDPRAHPAGAGRPRRRDREHGVNVRADGCLGGIPGASLTVVGDSDQSIYAFRGADIRNIVEFERDFPGAKVVLLEQNYRSTQNILSAANAVISQQLRPQGEEPLHGRRRRRRRSPATPGTPRTTRRSSSPTRSRCCTAPACLPRHRRVLPHQRADPCARGDLRPLGAARTASSAAPSSTSAPRSRTRWPTSSPSPTRSTSSRCGAS